LCANCAEKTKFCVAAGQIERKDEDVDEKDCLHLLKFLKFCGLVSKLLIIVE
jgi:hypothetical protein